MSGAWLAAAWLLAGVGLVAAGRFLPVLSGMAAVSWTVIVIGCVALILGATQWQVTIGTLLDPLPSAQRRTGADRTG